ncbi:two-component system OmpR family response regulator [Limimaricola variabilis]|uniref:Two-component system OmpR family response regulator n=1 Tax=Limimaricola variabilis TaxID=1492771 RepID=A0ABR6HMJ0_9RHOB|nr:response regulator transcription factor [Limimaricola variabilis]MBB3711781.1 two-component system OmpR family response regulator [Limimaricola variabilis]
MRIVLIEDNEGLAKGLSAALRDHGFAVDWLADGAEGERFLRNEGADIAIIDVNLPGLGGLEILRSLRVRGDAVPVLMLTAMGKTSDRVTGLEAGADDYLVKPFEVAELVARLRALARRRPELRANVESFGALRLDRAARRLSGPAGPIDLPRRELALFEVLAANSGRIVEKQRIAATLYGTGSEVEPNAVEILVSRLRRKIEGHGVTIRTARGLGYMLDDGGA